MNKICYLGFLLIALFLFSCKEDKDDISPSITFIGPSENSNYNVLDTAIVEASISDNEIIETVIVRLISSETSNAVLSSQSFSPNSPRFDLDILFDINDSLLNSGQYYFQIEARDKENTSSAFRFISINGIRKRKLSTIVSITDGTSTDLYEDKNDFNFKLLKSFSSGYQASVVNSHDQHYWHLPGNSNQLTVINLSDKQIKHSESYNSVYSQTFTDAVNVERDIILSTNDGELDGFNQQFSDNYTYRTKDERKIGNVAVGESFILAEEFDKNGANRNIKVLLRNLGFVQNTIPVLDSVIAMFFYSDKKALVFHKLLNGGAIADLDVSLSSLTRVATTNSKIKDVVQISLNEYVISTAIDLRSYKISNRNMLTYALETNSILAYDELSDHLYVARDNVMKRYIYRQNVIDQTEVFFKDVGGINFRYNRN